MLSVLSWLQKLLVPPKRKRRSFRRPSLYARRRLTFESCEPRLPLASDISVTGFDADGQHLVVHYDISGDNAAPFSIAVYGSPDGSTGGSMIGFLRVTGTADRAAGTGHSVEIDASLASQSGDILLWAVADSGAEIAETSETNNQHSFEGGVFLSGGGEVNIHGTSANDSVQVSCGTTLSVVFNGQTYTYQPLLVTNVYVWGHDGDDEIAAVSNVFISLTVQGGAGNDTINGGSGNDLLFGGLGNDTISAGAGNDTIYGNDGDDILDGNGGTNQISGGAGNNTIYNSSNTPPSIINFNGTPVANMWSFTGQVVDNTSPAGYVITFGGLLNGYSTTAAADGYFVFNIQINFGLGGLVTAQTIDLGQLLSTLVFDYV